MKFIEIEKNDGVMTVSLNRPELHNAFNAEMIAELTSCFKEAAEDAALRTVILQGNGKSFCAGGDLEWMKSMKDFTLEENERDSLALFDMYKTIFDCPVPVIGKIHGHAFGGGVGLAAVCDIAAAEEDTKFCFSEAKLGLAPAVISPFVSEKCRPNKVLEWTLTAKVFKAKEALRGGLVHFRGDENAVGEFVDEQVKMIAKNGKEAVSATKALLRQIAHLDWQQRRERTARVIAERRVSAEGQEGLNAFFEKRQPNWVRE